MKILAIGDIHGDLGLVRKIEKIVKKEKIDMVLLAGGKPKIIKCSEADNFKLTPSKLRKAITKKTKWIIFNSPSNPTGASYTKAEINKLSKILIKKKKFTY